jgi:beta-lactamase superfamily II metal-dependent hydrolase
VKTTGAAVNGRTPVRFRSRNGFIDAGALSTKAALELYLIDVGQGDAAFIVTPRRKKILIDGGLDKRAHGFLSWKYELKKATAPKLVIDLMVVSHADADHVAGLVPIVQDPKIEVKRIVQNYVRKRAALAAGVSGEKGRYSYGGRHSS